MFIHHHQLTYILTTREAILYYRTGCESSSSAQKSQLLSARIVLAKLDKVLFTDHFQTVSCSTSECSLPSSFCSRARPAWYWEGRKLKLTSCDVLRILLIIWISVPLLSQSLSSVQLMSNSSLYPPTYSGPLGPHSSGEIMLNISSSGLARCLYT